MLLATPEQPWISALILVFLYIADGLDSLQGVRLLTEIYAEAEGSKVFLGDPLTMFHGSNVLPGKWIAMLTTAKNELVVSL